MACDVVLCTLQIGVNGIISFDREFSPQSPVNFPSLDGDIHFAYLVSPYWSNVDTRREGRVIYEHYSRGDSDTSDDQIDSVTQFLNDEQDTDFTGEWMMLVSWEKVHPYPHGESADLERENPYLESVRRFIFWC